MNTNLQKHFDTNSIHEAYARLNSTTTALNEVKALQGIAYDESLKAALSKAEDELTSLKKQLEEYCFNRQMADLS